MTLVGAVFNGVTVHGGRMNPEQMVPVLNGYFRAMSAAITAHHGRVTELMGDGLLALFGALEPNPWQAQDAVLGALAMREALARYNETLRARSMPVLEVGIGIHRGEVLADFDVERLERWERHVDARRPRCASLQRVAAAPRDV